MEEVFKFVVVRKPETPSEDKLINLAPEAPAAAGAAPAAAAPQATAPSAGPIGQNASDSVAPPASQASSTPEAVLQDPTVVKTLTFRTKLDALSGAFSSEAVKKAAGEAFQDKEATAEKRGVVSMASLVADASFVAASEAVRQAVLQLTSSDPRNKALPDLVRALQGQEALRKVATAKDFDAAAFGRKLRATVVVPAPPAALVPPVTAPAPAPGPDPKNVDPLKRIAQLGSTLAELNAMRTTTLAASRRFQNSTVVSTAAVRPPPTSGFWRIFSFATITPPPPVAVSPDPPLVLSAEVSKGLSLESQIVLQNAGLEGLSLPFGEAIGMLEQLREAQVRDLRMSEISTRKVLIGSNVYTTVKSTYAGGGGPGSASPVGGPDGEAPPAVLPSVPPHLQAVGWADLKVVRQNILRYEAGEIAHVENVMLGEKRSRKVDQKRSTELTTLDETETTHEDTRDLQTTDRFELKQEADQVTKEDSSLKTGLTVSAHYGPYLDVSANVGYQQNNSKEESTKLAATYSKDVTNRAASKVTERVRTERTSKIVQSTRELDKHSFSGTKSNVIGIYQWLDKIYEAQVFNYGSRLLFDVVVPEPAAFLIDAMMNPAEDTDLLAPEEFGLLPQDLSEEPNALILDAQGDPTVTPADFRFYVTRYRVTGAEPPPPKEVTISESIVAKVDEGTGKDGEQSGSMTVKDVKMKVPDGFVAKSVWIRARLVVSGSDYYELFVSIAGQAFAVSAATNGMWLGELNVDPVTESLPVAISAINIQHYVLTVQVRCERSEQALTRWQLTTHTAIVAARQKLQDDFESTLAAIRLRQSTQVNWGSNPDVNRITVQAELKKACLSIITEQQFGWLGAISDPSIPGADHAYPQVDLTKAGVRGSYVKFFEEAFEWEHIVYMLYPYFWGRKSRWYDRVRIDDNDPMFRDFLRAGSARVVVPARPGFELAIANYLEHRTLWDGQPFVDVASLLYVPITEEIKASQDAAGLPPQPEGDPWEVRVPTSLVKLRDDTSLPVWVKTIDPLTQDIKWFPGKWDEAAGQYVKDLGQPKPLPNPEPQQP